MTIFFEDRQTEETRYRCFLSKDKKEHTQNSVHRPAKLPSNISPNLVEVASKFSVFYNIFENLPNKPIVRREGGVLEIWNPNIKTLKKHHQRGYYILPSISKGSAGTSLGPIYPPIQGAVPSWTVVCGQSLSTQCTQYAAKNRQLSMCSSTLKYILLCKSQRKLFEFKIL